MVYDLGIPGFAPREWLADIIWMWEDERDKQVLIGVAENSDSVNNLPRRNSICMSSSSQYVRARTESVYRYETLPMIGDVHQTRLTCKGDKRAQNNIAPLRSDPPSSS